MASLCCRRYSGGGPDHLAPVSAGERVEESNNSDDLPIGQHAVELRNAHGLDRLWQRGCAAVVKIGRRGRHVAQTRNTQQLRFGRTKLMKDIVPLKEIATDVDALMTGDAAERLEELISGNLLRR